MSTINEALKKAQNEKDRRLVTYRAILSAGHGKHVYPQKKHLTWVIIPVVLIIGFLASDAWLKKNNTLPPVSVETDGNQVLQGLSFSTGHKESADKFYNRARNFHRTEQFALAKRFYHEALRIDPDHPQALNNLGVICLIEKDYTKAEKHFLRALNRNADSADVYYNLACLYALRGSRKRGLDHLQYAVQLNPEARAWAKKDNDLDGLRGEPAFEALINQ
jgi:tetratricopeptide (TPR) repeat protein